MSQDRLILRNETSPYNGAYSDITQGSVLSWAQMDGNFIYLKGQSIYTATTNSTTISLKKLNGDSIDVPVVIDQDNKFKVVNYSFGDSITSIADKINQGEQFEIDEKQILLVVASILPRGGTMTYRKYVVNNLGKGTYGLGGTAVNEEDVELLYSQVITSFDIENDPNNQIITISSLSGSSISNFVNAKNPPYVIQNESVRMFKIIDDEESYIFTASGGTYGFGSLTTTNDDFTLIPQASEPITNTSQLTNDGDGVSLFATQVVVQELINESISQVVVRVTNASQLVNQVLNSNYLYVIENQITIGSGESIIVPATGLTLRGYGFNISSIFSSTASGKIFTSPVGGSGDLIIAELEITNVGTGSKTFDIFDADGTHAIEFEYVNFSGCKSLGIIDGYRQGTCTTAGLYGCADGLQLAGVWNGFKITNTNIFGFGAAGTLFKKDVDTTFANRFFVNINADFPTGSILTDFTSSNFLSNELFQINSSIVKVNSIINSDIANTIIPNLSANDNKCLWIGNIGLPDSAQENFVDTTISGTYQVDWLKDTFFLTMTGDTTFTERNLPASGKNTGEIKIYLQGQFTPTFSSGWTANMVGTYKGSDINEITLKFIKTGVYFMKINNSLSVYPAPSLQNLVPTSLLPSNTASLTINGSFFTPETIVFIENQTVNSITFINQGQLVLSVTTSGVEEEVDITISNGTSVIFSGVLPINFGVVYIPTEPDWEDITGSPDVTMNGIMALTQAGISSSGVWNQVIDFSKDWIVSVTPSNDPFYVVDAAGGYNIKLINAVGGTVRLELDSNIFTQRSGFDVYENGVFTFASGLGTGFPNAKIELKYDTSSGILRLWTDNVFRYEFPVLPFSDDLKLKLQVSKQRFVDIKYIELP